MEDEYTIVRCTKCNCRGTCPEKMVGKVKCNFCGSTMLTDDQEYELRKKAKELIKDI